MPFFQSYGTKVVVSKLAQGFLEVMGESEKDAKKMGNAFGTFMGGMVAIGTADAAGAAAIAADASHDSSPSDGPS